MADFTDAETAAPIYPSFGLRCEHCNRQDMSNMTWQDGAKHFFSTFLSAPRMWPVGYILGSPYSPLRVERAMPSKNWRNAFEDLLALEAGRSMIKDEHRRAEDAYAAQNRFMHSKAAIAIRNNHTQDSLKFESELQRAAAEAGDVKAMKALTEKIFPVLRAERERDITESQELKIKFEKERNATASSLMPRGQWIASLMTSGALPSWKWAMGGSVQGTVMEFSKSAASPELEARFLIPEEELFQVFERDQPHDFGNPTPLASHHIKLVTEGGVSFEQTNIPEDPYKDFQPSKSSILIQSATPEPVKLPDGSRGTKIKIENTLVSGEIVTKVFTEQPGQLLEEVENARTSMFMMLRAINGLTGPENDAEGMERLDEFFSQLQTLDHLQD